MALPGRQHFTFDEYLGLEEIARVKHEYLAGQVWAMAGGSPDHARVCANVSGLLSAGLAGKPCTVFSSHLRVRATSTGLGTYPDVAVVCGRLELDPEDRKQHTVTNPRVVVEVLSPSTEEVVLVSHDRREIEVVRREKDGSWSRHVASGDTPAVIGSLGVSLSIDDVYRNPLAT